MSFRLSTLLAAGLFGFAISAPQPATAVGNDPPAQTQSQAPKGTSSKAKKKKKSTKSEKRSERKFLDGYKVAYNLIYTQKDYAAGIAQLKLLSRDEHPDVANLIGFSSRKLGRYDDAKTWYEKALVSDPKHSRTWSYYGMWHAEQGNVLKARDHLAKVQSLCGTACKDYVELKEVIDGTRTY